jgi:hypothetical protein
LPTRSRPHMAAPTNAANVKKALANSEPSTHGTKWTIQPRPRLSALGQEQALGGNSTEWIGSD